MSIGGEYLVVMGVSTRRWKAKGDGGFLPTAQEEICTNFYR